MLSAVSEKFRHYLGPNEATRKRLLERDYSDGDSDIEVDKIIDGPASKKSRLTLHNGESNGDDRPGSYITEAPSVHTPSDTLLSKISNWMSSIGWTSSDEKIEGNRQPKMNPNKLSNHITREKDIFRHIRERTSVNDDEVVEISKPAIIKEILPSPITKLSNGFDTEEDIKYVGSTLNEGSRPTQSRYFSTPIYTPSTSSPPPPRLYNGIDTNFRFKPSITSTAARISKDFFSTRRESKSILGPRSPITKDFPHTKVSTPKPISKFLPRTKKKFTSFVVDSMRKVNANPRESIRLEEKLKYQELLQQHAKSGLASSTFKFPFLSRGSSLGSSVEILDVKSSGGAVIQTKINKSQLNADTPYRPTPRPPLHTNNASSVNNIDHKLNDSKSKYNNDVIDLIDDKNKTNESEKDDDDDLTVTAVISPPPVRRRNSLEESFQDHEVYNKNWIKDFISKKQAKQEARERDVEIAKALSKKLEERTKRVERSLETRLKNKLSLLDLTFPVVIQEVKPEKEEFPPLTDKIESIINNAFARGPPAQVLAEKFNIQVTRRDISTLAGLNWLNDEVVNFYMNLIMDRSKNDEKVLKVYAYNTFFYPKLMKTGFSSIKRWTKKVDVFSQDLLLVPVHLGMHWCLATMDIRHKTINYYDSMLGDKNDCLKALLDYLHEEHQDKKKSPFDATGWTCENIKDIPQQMNGSDCGMFACKFAEYLSRDAEITFSQEHMPYFRRRMVYEIVTNELL